MNNSIKVVLITSDELRHDFFRVYISNQNCINISKSYVEKRSENIINEIANTTENIVNHFNERKEIENDFFGVYVNEREDRSNPVEIKANEINSEQIINEIVELSPDFIVTFGCSIIKTKLIALFPNKIINIHLGLSPYYRGSGTNIFPIVNEELQFIGSTIMFLDSGIDTGEIIHQLRAKILSHDSHHQIGNRLIRDTVIKIPKILDYLSSNRNYNLEKIEFPQSPRRVYKRKEFTNEILNSVYTKLNEGVIENYLRDQSRLNLIYPIQTIDTI